MLIIIILIFFFPLVLTGETNYTLTPYNECLFTCTSSHEKFQFWINTEDIYDDLLQSTFTFSLQQKTLKLNTTNINKTYMINETFLVDINFVFHDGSKTLLPSKKNLEAGEIINYHIIAQKGNILVSLACVDDDDILINSLGMTFFPGNVTLKRLEFDSGYELVSVPGFFSGTYTNYETFIIYAFSEIYSEKSKLRIRMDICIGNVNIMHMNSNEVNQFLKDRKLVNIIKNDNSSNNFLINLKPLLNFLVIQGTSGVVFQFGSPSRAMLRIRTRLLEDYQIMKPIFLLKSKGISYIYNFPQVFLNFSKVEFLNDSLNNNNGTDMMINNTEGNKNSTQPIYYKIIIAQSYLFLSIAAKCGLDVLEDIPKNGNFKNINTYYKEIILDDFKRMNNSDEYENYTNNDSMDFDRNQTNKRNHNKSNPNNTNNTLNNTNFNISNISNETSENFSPYYTLKPYTLYEDVANQSNFNLLISLEAKDYYFITIIGYLREMNETYYFYEPVLIKDERYSDDGNMDFGFILISIFIIILLELVVILKNSCRRYYFWIDPSCMLLQMH